MVNAGPSVRDITECFLDLERAHGLLQRPFAGVEVWPLQRMPLYYAVTRAAGTFGTAHADMPGAAKIARAVPRIARDLFTRNPLRGGHQRDTLVFDHMRKVEIDGRFVDIYSQPLIDALEPGSYEVYEPFFQRVEHPTDPAPERRFLDSVLIGTEIAQRVPLRFASEERALLAEVEAALKARLGVEVSLTKRFARAARGYRFAHRYYTRLLTKRRPKRIYLVVSYSAYKLPLIAAARDLGIETVELQHGTISPFHLGYHFPESETLRFFPDVLYTFGDYWQTAASYPTDRLKTTGFGHFNAKRARFEDVERREQVLFISQGVIGAPLSALALELARAQPNRRVVYKLHPGEYQRWREDYPALVEAAALSNVEVVDHNRRDLYAWFAESSHQVGVFSTAMYEGLAFGCRTCVVDLPGAEYMQALVASGAVHRVDGVDALVAGLDSAPRTDFDRGYFFAEEIDLP